MYTREESFYGLPRPLRADIQLWIHLVRTYIECNYFNFIAAIEINSKPGNPIPLGVGRKGSFFYKKIKKFSYFLLSPEKSSILNMTEQKSTESAERRKANGSKRAECNDIHKGKIVS